MDKKYKSYFDFAIRYTKFAFLPPFVPSSLYYIGILNFFITGILVLRSILMITEEGKKNFETYFMMVAISKICIGSILFFFQKNDFDHLLNTIEIFLNDNDKNPIHEEGTKFISIWNKYKPNLLSKFYFWPVITNGLLWVVRSNYQFIFSGDLSHSPIPFYSPYLKWNVEYRILAFFFDTLLVFLLTFQIIQSDLIVIVLLRFIRCQFMYLKDLLKEIFESNVKECKDDDIKCWVKNHILVLR